MTHSTESRRALQPVLIVDDEPDLCELLAITLQRMEIPSQAVHTLADARRALIDGTFACCLTDLRLPDGDGLELLAWIQEQLPGLPVAVITAHGNVESAVRALKLGAFDYLSKPLDLQELRRGVAQAGTLGYWIGKPFARQGYMTAAVRLLLQVSFGPLGLHRVEAACLPHNAASIALLGRCGFEHEGLARGYLKIAGTWQDHLLFARLAGQ